MKIRVSDLRDIIRETIDRVLTENADKKSDIAKEADEAWDETQYMHAAHKIVMNYGMQLDFNWSRAVSNYVRAQKSFTGVNIDADKLYAAVNDEIEQSEDERVNPTLQIRSAGDE
jgi:hypothetical protein